MSEDEYLEISDIKRDQSGEYECSALNDVAAPDVRKVKITVNCELICCQGTPEGKGRGLNQQSRSDSALFSKPRTQGPANRKVSVLSDCSAHQPLRYHL